MRSTPVRTATPADAAAITAVHLASRAAAMPWLPVLHTEQEVLARVRDVVLPGSRVWVAQAASPGGLTLQVFARDAAARAFYAHHGFEVGAADDGSGEEDLPDVTCRGAPPRYGCAPLDAGRRVGGGARSTVEPRSDPTVLAERSPASGVDPSQVVGVSPARIDPDGRTGSTGDERAHRWAGAPASSSP